MADYRDIAVEECSDDLFAVATQSAANREMTHILLGMVADRDRKIDSLQRQNRHITDEYKAHRERTMRASPAESASDHLVRGDAANPARTYTTQHGTARRPVSQRSQTTQYIPIGTACGSQDGADA